MSDCLHNGRGCIILFFSEATHARSSIPQPTSDFGKYCTLTSIHDDMGFANKNTLRVHRKFSTEAHRTIQFGQWMYQSGLCSWMNSTLASNRVVRIKSDGERIRLQVGVIGCAGERSVVVCYSSKQPSRAGTVVVSEGVVRLVRKHAFLNPQYDAFNRNGELPNSRLCTVVFNLGEDAIFSEHCVSGEPAEQDVLLV